jgi:hypothetical protein
LKPLLPAHLGVGGFLRFSYFQLWSSKNRKSLIAYYKAGETISSARPDDFPVVSNQLVCIHAERKRWQNSEQWKIT